MYKSFYSKVHLVFSASVKVEEQATEILYELSFVLCRIWGTLSGSHECCQPVCKPKFRRNISPPISGSKISRARNQDAADGWTVFRLHGYAPKDGNVHVPASASMKAIS